MFSCPLGVARVRARGNVLLCPRCWHLVSVCEWLRFRVSSQRAQTRNPKLQGSPRRGSRQRSCLVSSAVLTPPAFVVQVSRTPTIDRAGADGKWLAVATMPDGSKALGNNESFKTVHAEPVCAKGVCGEFVLVKKHLLRDLISRELWTEQLHMQLIAHNGKRSATEFADPHNRHSVAEAPATVIDAGNYEITHFNLTN